MREQIIYRRNDIMKYFRVKIEDETGCKTKVYNAMTISKCVKSIISSIQRSNEKLHTMYKVFSPKLAVLEIKRETYKDTDSAIYTLKQLEITQEGICYVLGESL